jgi:Cu+-exporting ATPase
MVKDVVCGMTIDPQSATEQSQYRGQTYYFCAKGCKTAFDKDPEKYVGVQHDEHAGCCH